MREAFPILSGPGHSLVLFICVSIAFFAPVELLAVLTNKDYLGPAIAGFVILGTSAGILFNTLYSGLWSAFIGYHRIGHSRRYWLEYRNRLSPSLISSVHDAAFWSHASGEIVDYVRRRWSQYHVSSQIMIVSLLSMWFPLIIYVVYRDKARMSSSMLVIYESLMLVLTAATRVTCVSIRKSVSNFMEEMMKDRDEAIRFRLDVLAARMSTAHRRVMNRQWIRFEWLMKTILLLKQQVQKLLRRTQSP